MAAQEARKRKIAEKYEEAKKNLVKWDVYRQRREEETARYNFARD